MQCPFAEFNFLNQNVSKQIICDIILKRTQITCFVTLSFNFIEVLLLYFHLIVSVTNSSI